MFHGKTSFEEARQQMVERQLAQRGIVDERVLQAMREVPRHRFVPEDLWDMAYRDTPLPIGYDQTISQPYIVAYMTQMLHLSPDDRVLEVGTGSGYQAAILSRLAKQVYTIERVEGLAQCAEQVLQDLDYRNVLVRIGDGGYGWPEAAPFDAIIITAAAPEVPPPLIAQLAEDAPLVTPVGPAGYQELVRLHKRGDQTQLEHLVPVAFVPLVGEHGWREWDLTAE
ncbi:MAG: protein-L-isoaspartate(D-aspartate) O-methyltransferase [Anaerolineales bacterium]|nr:MAG: protein-L-isoaspartate(D-aspartate) O-methyltransferase [Anaerolineales bacterium]